MASSSLSPSTLFISSANAHLAQLQSDHDMFLATADHVQLHFTLRRAQIIRNAAVVHRAVHDIIALPSSPSISPHLKTYFLSLLPQLESALRDHNYDTLFQFTAAAQQVLDCTVTGLHTCFTPLDDVVPIEIPSAFASIPAVTSSSGILATRSGRPSADIMSPSIVPSELDDEERNNHSNTLHAFQNISTKSKSSLRATHRSFCFPSITLSDLSRRDKGILALYILMVLASIICITTVTVDFVRESVDPSGFISSAPQQNLSSPVVTVCLSQTGIPFSRLQLFNFTDAEGSNFKGADPYGPQDARVSPEFSAVVERFWENPDNENCTQKVGDFFPFPLRSLQSLVDGLTTTKCRQCYRVGSKHTAFASSSAFQKSSVLSFYTDNYFLQCLKSVAGLNEPSLDFLHDQLFEKRQQMADTGVLKVKPDVALSVANLSKTEFIKVTAEQACNIFYFAFFPITLNLQDPSVNIQYEFDGNAWNETGDGPYFRTRNETDGLLPTESLQMFVESNESAQNILPGEYIRTLGAESDMILIGPNTQTYATFRKLDVFGRERFDISSSTSNLWQSDITPIFGYWLVYRIYYNYNRFVTDTYYQQSTYPAGQWLVDVTGYASLFTGASVFSLLLLPLLRALHRSEKQQLLQQKPEGYVWSKYRRKLDTVALDSTLQSPRFPFTDRGGTSNTNPARASNMLLPGLNL